MWAAAGFLFILRGETMILRLFSRAMYGLVRWKARRGLLDEGPAAANDAKLAAQRTGVRGETFAYWYLRRQGYVFVARNYSPLSVKGELDLVGYDGETLAF